jgi:hypothetical protein
MGGHNTEIIQGGCVVSSHFVTGPSGRISTRAVGRPPLASSAGAEEEEKDGRDEGAAAEGHQHLVGVHHALFSRRLLVSTETLENDIAAAATIGFSSQPVNG